LWGTTFFYCAITMLLIINTYIYIKNPVSPITPTYRIVMSIINYIVIILRQLKGFAIILIIYTILIFFYDMAGIPALVEEAYMTITTFTPEITLWVNLYGTTFIYCVLTVVIIILAYWWFNFVYNYFIKSETLITFIIPVIMITTIRSIAFIVLIVIIALIAPMPLEFYIPIVASLLFILILPIIAITTPVIFITNLTLIVL